MADSVHELAPHYLPGFLPGPDGSDWLFTAVMIGTVILVVLLGTLYLTLHALPEKMAHRGNHVQLQLISILAVLALFTHNNLFWVIALAIAAIRVPDFMTPLQSIAESLAAIRNQGRPVARDEERPDA
jgi:hypothetical protein